MGKTSLAKALALSIDCSVSRVQFTPDLLPGDITGMSIYNRQTEEFEFRPGPVFANVVIADEINRASPKTQSALLECMAEHQVTVDGVTYGLASRFLVVATQNPIEMDGTYPLPEAQRDRFTARVSIGYPDPAAELTMLDEHAAADPLEQLRPVADATSVQAVIEAVRRIRVGQEVRQYCVDLVTATRRLPDLRLGASPRATLQLVRAARTSCRVARGEAPSRSSGSRRVVATSSTQYCRTSRATCTRRTASTTAATRRASVTGRSRSIGSAAACSSTMASSADRSG